MHPTWVLLSVLEMACGYVGGPLEPESYRHAERSNGPITPTTLVGLPENVKLCGVVQVPA